MRDHPAHTAYVMGGTWGAKVFELRNEFLSAFGKLFKDGLAYIQKEKGGGYDQVGKCHCLAVGHNATDKHVNRYNLFQLG